ncbi:MAG: thiol reductase thioredoxin [Anaerolineae bacterium]|nr:thiol reductase thioredoxin [Anaerolineae bacterium]
MAVDLLRRLFGRGRGASQPDDDPPALEPRPVTDADFEEVILKATMPAVVDFWADWCGPCHALAPSIARLVAEYEGRAIIARLNVDENGHWPAHYDIQGIPTVLFVSEGEVVHRLLGVTSYSVLKQKLDALLET